MCYQSHSMTLSHCGMLQKGSTSEFVTIDDEYGPVTSVSWAPDGCHIAIGLDSINRRIGWLVMISSC